MQGGEGATVRDRCDRCGGRCDGGIGTTGWLEVARLVYFRFYFLLEQREREIEQRTAGVAGGALGWLAGWLGTTESREQGAESRE